MIGEQTCVALLQGSKMPPGLHSNNLKWDILCFRIITSNSGPVVKTKSLAPAK